MTRKIYFLMPISIAIVVAALVGTVSAKTSYAPLNFTRTLQSGSVGEDVRDLQKFLNTFGLHRFDVASSGLGSPGEETVEFGNATKRAVTLFQETYRDEILTPNGLTQGSGIFGPSSIKKANQIIEQSNNNSSSPSIQSSAPLKIGTQTATVADTQTPSVPTGLSATSTARTSTVLSWTRSTDNIAVTGYKIYKDGVQLATPTVPPYTVSGLTAGTSYTFTVASYDAAGNTSAQSTPISITTVAPYDGTPPTPPTNLVASNVTSTSVTISWTAGTDNVGIAGYKFYRNSGLVTLLDPVTTYTDTGLVPGRQYQYSIRSVDPTGNNAVSTTLTVTTPLTSSATTPSTSSVTTSQSTTQTTTSTTPSSTTNQPTAQTTTSTANTTSSSADTTAPSIPSGVAVSAVTQSQITITWTGSTDAVGVAGYKVYRAGVLQATLGNVNSYTNTGLTAGTAYTYTVAAYDTAGNISASSSQITVSTSAATTQQQNTQTTTDVTTTTGGTFLVGSRVQISTNTSVYALPTDVPATVPSLSYPNLQRVLTTTLLGSIVGGVVKDSAGVNWWNIDFDSGSDGWVKESRMSLLSTQDRIAPPTPTGISASAVASDQINLTWLISRDNVSAGIVKYKIFRNGVYIFTTASLNYQDTDLSPNTSYSYTIQAYDLAGNMSAQSSQVSATTLLSSSVSPLDNISPGTWWAAPNSQIKNIDFIWPGNTASGNYPDYFTESSGAFDSKRNRFYVHGGGHHDYQGNEIYGFDVTTLQWRTVSQPALFTDPSSATESSSYYPDQNGNVDYTQPRSVHSYNYLQYVPAIDRFCRFGATATFTSGQRGGSMIDCYNFDTKQWEKRGNVTYWGSSVVPSTAVDPTNSHVWFWQGGAGISEWNPLSGIWTLRGSVENDSGYYTGLVDPKRHRFLRFGTSGLYWYDIGSSGILPKNKATLTGDTEIALSRRPGFVYDATDDVYVAWNGEMADDDGDGTIDHVILPESVYVINPDTFVVKRIGTSSLSVVPRTSYSLDSGANNATFTRFNYIPSKNVFILVNNTKTENVLFYKLNPAAISGTVPSDKVNPTAVTNLTARATSNSSITLAWNPSTDNVGIVGYRVARLASKVQSTIQTVTGTSFTDNGLTAGTKYSYAVIAVDSSGNISPMSVVTLVATAGTTAGGNTPTNVTSNQSSGSDTQAPTVPSNVRVTASTVSSITISWSGSSDNVGVTGYTVLKDGSVVATLGNVTSYTSTGLTADTAYSYSVQAFDAANNRSASSSIVNTRTPITNSQGIVSPTVNNATSTATTTQNSINGQGPTTPQGLSLSSPSSSQINLTWLASSDSVGVVGYKIYRNGTQIGTSPNTSYTDSGLSASTLYLYTVQAYNAAGGVSSESQSVSGSTRSNVVVNGSLSIPITVQELLASGETGANRSNDLASFGIPLKDSDGIQSVNQLGMTGANLYQFKSLGYYPSGNIQWVLVDALASVAPGGSTSMILTNGSGNSGGANMAVDSGSTITIDTTAAQFTIRKNGFNIFDKVVVGGTTLVSPGNNGGAVLTLPGNLAYSSLYDTPTVTITENGPVKSIVKVEGRFKNSAGAQAPLGYTVYFTFVKGSSNAKVVPVLRNAYYATHAVVPIDSFEIVVPTLVNQSPVYSLPTSKGNQTGTLSSSESAYLLQGYTKYLADASYSDFWQWKNATLIAQPLDITTDIGAKVVKGNTTLKGFSSDDTGDYGLGYGELKDDNNKGVTVAFRNFAAFFPASFEFGGDGTVTVGIFSKRNNKKGLGIDWNVHDSRDIMFNFHTAPIDNTLVNSQIQNPLFGRASFEQYRDSGSFFGEKRLASMQEQQAIFAANGRPNFTIPNAPRGVTRLWESGQGGTLNQRDLSLAWQLTYVRTGDTGQMVNAINRTEFVADQFVWHSDDFDYGLAANDYHFTRKTPVIPVNGRYNQFEEDFEHIWVYSLFMSYYFTGDERYKNSLNDLAEAVYSRTVTSSDSNIFSRLGLSAARIAAQSYALTGDARYLARMDKYVIYLLSTESKYPNTPKIGRNLDRGFVPTPDGGLPQAAHSLFLNTYFPATLYEVLRNTPDNHIYQSSAYPGKAYTKQDLADFLEGLGYFNIKESYNYPSNNGKPWVAYDYDTLVPDTSTSGRVYDFGRGASLAYESTGDKSFLTLGTQLAVNVDKDQDTVSNSDIGNLHFLYDVAHPNDIKVQYIPLVVDKVGTGSYKLTWTVPADANVYQLKYSNRAIVPNLNFNGRTYTYEFNPANYISFWAAPYVPNTPTPASVGSTQTISVSNLPCGDVCQFKLRAQATIDGVAKTSGGSIDIGNSNNGSSSNNSTNQNTQSAPVVSNADTQSPVTSITSPGAGSTLIGSAVITATATDNVGVTGVTLKIDGQVIAEDTVAPYTFTFNTNAVSNGSHTLTVEARDSAGNKGTSTSIAVSVLNSTVVLPQLVNVSSSAALSTATITITANKNVTALVEYGTTASYGNSSSVSIQPSGSVVITNLNAGTLYHYRVTIDDGVNGKVVSGDSQFKTIVSNSGSSSLAAVENLNLQKRTARTVELSWTAPTSTGAFIKPATYEVRYVVNDVISVDNWNMATVLPSNTTGVPATTGLLESLRLQNLSPGTTYSIGVRTKDAQGNLSPISNVITVKTRALPPKPSTPTITFGSVVLSWPSASYAEGAIYYEVIRSNAPLVSQTDPASIVIGTTTLSTMIDQNVSEGSSYYYGIFSVNDTGDFSDMVTTFVTVPYKQSSNNNTGGGNIPVVSNTVSTQTTNTSSVPSNGPISTNVSIATFGNNLVPGMETSDVKRLQQFLIANGYLASGNDNGYYGNATKAATGKFQCEQKITCLATDAGYGSLGPVTRARVNDLINKGLVSFSSQTGTQSSTVQSTVSSTAFSRNLKLGMKGEDVRALQQFLNAKGFTVASTGPGSQGSETTYFGLATSRALIRFQEAHAAEILTPYGLPRGTGFFGSVTRGVVQSLLK